VNEAEPPGIGTVYEVNDAGWQQLQGSSTVLSSAALRMLVLVNGKLSLEQIAAHLKDVPETRLCRIALDLEQQGHIRSVKHGEPAKAAAFDVIDFFSGRSVDAKAGGAPGDPDQARKLEAETQNFAAMLKAHGYAVRIARQTGETVKPASGGAYTVLFVEDAPTLLSAVCAFLEMEGYVPRRAANRAEVVAELRKTPSPDLIILDVGLPDISGFDILERVRSHPALKHIPIIMVTGKATREDVMRALGAGANGYITKPFEFDSLMSSIRAVLGLDLEPPAEPKAGA
jgi:CheY-like chemotaxis protein